MLARVNRKTGFTLVEILIVVIILGILAAIVIPQFSNASNDARMSNLQSTVQTLRSQIQLYKLQHGDTLPNLIANWNDLINTSSYGTALNLGPTELMQPVTLVPVAPEPPPPPPVKPKALPKPKPVEPEPVGGPAGQDAGEHRHRGHRVHEERGHPHQLVRAPPPEIASGQHDAEGQRDQAGEEREDRQSPAVTARGDREHHRSRSIRRSSFPVGW